MSLPYFPMFPTDFEAKTSHLTLEEDGAYNRLLRLMWMTPGCALPDDDAWIMRRMRVDADTYERVVRVVIDEFCDRENGKVSNAKLTRIFDESSESHKRRVLAGSKGGKNKSRKTNENVSSNAKAKPKQPEPEPELDVSSNEETVLRAISFAEFWTIWPNKTAKAAAEKAWKKLSPAERAEAHGNATDWFAAWRAGHKDASPIHPATYLNQRRWQDEGWRKTAKPVDRVASAVDAIRSGKRFLCTNIPASLARELVAANQVTTEQCKSVGVL